MEKKINIFAQLFLVFIVAVSISTAIAMPVKAEGIAFNELEREYIANAKVLKASSNDGAAPLHYTDSNGEIKGISINVLEEISEMTGLVFEYHLFDTVEDAYSENADIYFGVPNQYTLHDTILSAPYLQSDTVLFYNRSCDPKDLDDGAFAGIKDVRLPNGIKEERTTYYDDREATIIAVNKGHADYGYGNAYSVAYYTLQNNCSNIAIIPTGKEERQYCIGVKNNDEVLLSIINKAIESIDKGRMDSMILDVASQVDRTVTFDMIINAYGKTIFTAGFITIIVLIFGIYSCIRTGRNLNIVNKRYVILSQLSKEHLFEYEIKTNKLEISDKVNTKIDIDNSKDIISDMLKNSVKDIRDKETAQSSHIIELPLLNGDIGIYKMYFSYLREFGGKVHSIIGKLTDISEEEKERKLLIVKSQLDGLTGLYNASTTKEAIINMMGDKDPDRVDALIIIDCDKFKEINDSYGHLQGDLALGYISQGLKSTFRQSDIVGRIGGDEFIVYMQNIPSVDFVRIKCQQLEHNVQELSQGIPINLSMGVSIFDKEITYEELFKKADDALYIAKSNGGSQVVVADSGDSRAADRDPD